MAAEDEDDAREDVPALETAVVPAAFPEEGEAAGAGADGRAPGEAVRDAAEIPAADGQRTEEALDGALARMADGGPVWEAEAAAQRREMAEVLGQAAETVESVRTEAAAGRIAGYEAGAEAAAGQKAAAGLERLYRQTVRAAAPPAPALPAVGAARTIGVEEPGSAASLAVDELDRAVRRDSRRYDGGLSIF